MLKGITANLFGLEQGKVLLSCCKNIFQPVNMFFISSVDKKFLDANLRECNNTLITLPHLK